MLIKISCAVNVTRIDGKMVDMNNLELRELIENLKNDIGRLSRETINFRMEIAAVAESKMYAI